MPDKTENLEAEGALQADIKISKSYQIKRFWHNFKKRKIAVLGLVIVLLYVAIAIAAPWIAPYDPEEANFSIMLKAPGTIEGHLLGTDELGRDILSRLVYGARISIGIGVTVVIAAFFIGVHLGIVSGYGCPDGISAAAFVYSVCGGTGSKSDQCGYGRVNLYSTEFCPYGTK